MPFQTEPRLDTLLHNVPYILSSRFELPINRGRSVNRPSHKKEVSVPNGDRQADILLLGCDKGVDVCVDFTITSPTSLDCYPLNPENSRNSRRHLNEAEKKAKRVKQSPPCDAMGWAHHPAADSPWAGQGAATKGLLHELLKRATADQQGWPKV